MMQAIGYGVADVQLSPGDCCGSASVCCERRAYWTRDWTADYLALTALTAEGHAKKALDMKVNKTDANMTSDLRSWYVLVGIVKSGSKARRLSIALLFFLLHCGDVFASQDPKVRRCFELAS